MKLISEKPVRVESIGTDGEEHQFQMEVSSKAFSILVDKLYTNKIGAVIRELSTNAYEAHQMNGNESEPFVVKLPSKLDLNFTIRDYGTGLSEEEIYNLYTVVFKSTKSNSNNVGGAFGLGSKAPLSYTKNFIVNSFFNGSKDVYSIYINESGIPSCKKMISVPTSERNGLEIIIPVNTSDIELFRTNAQDIYKWFKVEPKITGQQLDLRKEKVVSSGNGWFLLAGYHNYCYALMGNVAYKIDSYGFTGNNKSFIGIKGLVIEFNIGEIEPEPSRENISFNKATIKAIDDKIDLIKKDLKNVIQKEIDDSETYWSAFNKKEQLDSKFYNFGITGLTWRGSKLEQILVNIKYKSCNTRNERTLTSFSLRDTDKFYIADKKNTASRMKYNATGRYFVVNSEDEAKELSKELIIDYSTWIKSSTLPSPPAISRNTRKIKGTVLKLKYGYSAQGSWDDNIEVPKSGYYVEVSNNKIIINGKAIHPNVLYDFIERTEKIDVFGVKKSQLDKFTSNNNWKNISEFINKQAERCNGLYKTEMSETLKLNELSYSDKTFLKKIQKYKNIDKYLGFCPKLKDNVDNKYSKIVNLANVLINYTIPVVNNLDRISEKLLKFYDKYPLLKNIGDGVLEEDVIGYLKLKEKK